MLNYNLDSMEAAGKLTRMCEKYKGQMEIDVICGRQIIDAYSILGVHSLIGHIVSLEPQTDDTKVLAQFQEDLKEIS
mgnify:CR=1 FL=1